MNLGNKKIEINSETLLRNWGPTLTAVFLLALVTLAPSILTMFFGG